MGDATEQSLEALDTARVLFSFIQTGIHHFGYDDVLGACPTLSELKPQTFQRWMSNPFYTTHKGNGMYTFNYRPAIVYPFGTKRRPSTRNALDLIVLYAGYENFVRWLRIWSSHFGGIATANTSKKKALILALRKLNSDCKQWTLQQLYTEGKERLLEIYQQAYDYKGYPNYATVPVESGRKTVITFKRPLRWRNKEYTGLPGLPKLPESVALIIEEDS